MDQIIRVALDKRGLTVIMFCYQNGCQFQRGRCLFPWGKDANLTITASNARILYRKINNYNESLCIQGSHITTCRKMKINVHALISISYMCEQEFLY